MYFDNDLTKEPPPSSVKTVQNEQCLAVFGLADDTNRFNAEPNVSPPYFFNNV